jgi:hypothetical protein
MSGKDRTFWTMGLWDFLDCKTSWTIGLLIKGGWTKDKGLIVEYKKSGP